MKAGMLMMVLTIGMVVSLSSPCHAAQPKSFSYVYIDTVSVCKDYEVYITPPYDAVYEQWEMRYDHYFFDDREQDCVRNIVGAYDGTDYYMQGVFVRYPELWIRLTRDADGSFIIPFNQEVGYDREENRKILFNTYFLRNIVNNTGSNYIESQYGCIPAEIPYRFERDGDGRTFTAVDEQLGMDYGQGRFMSRNTYEIESGTRASLLMDFPSSDKTDKYRNVRLIQITDTGVAGVGTDPNGYSYGIYDLNGLPVSRESVRPGVYLRNGKKYVVK